MGIQMLVHHHTFAQMRRRFEGKNEPMQTRIIGKPGKQYRSTQHSCEKNTAGPRINLPHRTIIGYLPRRGSEQERLNFSCGTRAFVGIVFQTAPYDRFHAADMARLGKRLTGIVNLFQFFASRCGECSRTGK